MKTVILLVVFLVIAGALLSAAFDSVPADAPVTPENVKTAQETGENAGVGVIILLVIVCAIGAKFIFR